MGPKKEPGLVRHISLLDYEVKRDAKERDVGKERQDCRDLKLNTSDNLLHRYIYDCILAICGDYKK